MIKEFVVMAVLMAAGTVMLTMAYHKMDAWFTENTAYSKESKILKYIAE